MGEGSGDFEDELIDLNKVPVERKRKRVEGSSIDKEVSNVMPKTVRVLRSRTVGMSDGEKQETKMEIVIAGEEENDVLVLEDKDESKVTVLKKKKKRKGKLGRPRKIESQCQIFNLRNRKKERRGRPRKIEVNCMDSSLSNQKKERRGRPRKIEGKCEVSSIDDQKKDRRGRPRKFESKCEVSSLVDQKMERRGRPRKIEGKCEVPSLVDKEEERRGSPEKTEDKCEVPSLVDLNEERRGRPRIEGECEVPTLVDHKEERRGRPRKIGGRCEVSSFGDMKKERRGRPRKIEGKCEDFSLGDMKKERRGRPRKIEGTCDVFSLHNPKKVKRRGRPPKRKDDEVMEQKKVNMSSNGIGQDQERDKVKRKRGRPYKVDVERRGLFVDDEDARKIRNHKKAGHVSVKRLKVNTDDSVSGEKKDAVECAEGKEMAPREQKQLVRDRIVAMLMKAGWTIEHKQRQSRNYQDTIYVDRQGRGYWSVTLAYRKLKERIDKGNGEDEDVSAFSPIAEETLSLLFRNAEKGKKVGLKRNAGMTTKKRKRNVKFESRLNQGKQRTLLARKPKDGYKLYEGKRTLLSWMLDLGTVPLRGKVKYRTGKGERVFLEGRILKEGICCNCCNITHTVHEFASHAKSTSGKPYHDIHLESGNSLSHCLLDSWRKHFETNKIGFVCVDVEGDDPNDDTCNVCGDGGDLICCDSCPSTFHNGCLCIDVPLGDWYCAYCSCKFCGVACGSTSTTDDDCNLSSESCLCRLCEQKFHVQCIERTDADNFDDENPLFCGKECSKIFEQLQGLLGVGHQLEEGFSYTVLQHRVVGDDAPLDGDFSKIESNSKLAVAFSVMDECFQPIIDERSGTNMIHNVVYSCGSNIRRLNFEGFYTVILEKGDELVAVASIRIHGSQLAEMPFIGTRFLYRRQGMCSRLLTSIEMVLSSLGVEKLVIPAISELNETWTKVFGFVPIDESKRVEMKYMNMVVFPRVAMLQKALKGQTYSTVTECTDVGAGHQNMLENLTSDSKLCSDVKTQNQAEATEVKIGGSVSDDAPATEFAETETHLRNSQDEHGDNTASPADPEVGISGVKIHSDSNGPGSEADASATELAVLQNTQDGCSDVTRGPADTGVDISEVKIHSRSKGIAVEPEIQTHLQSTRDENGDITGDPAVPEVDSSGVKIHKSCNGAPIERGATVLPVDIIVETGANKSFDPENLVKDNGRERGKLEWPDCSIC